MNTPRLHHLKGRVVLVTGASRGLGRAVTEVLARSGVIVAATCRPESQQTLDDLARETPGTIMPITMDVREPAQIHAAVQAIIQKFHRIDALVNNAAVSVRSLVQDMDDEDIHEQLYTNFIGPLCLIRDVLPHMIALRQGRIVNVSSVGGMMAMPTMGMYSASKFAIEGLSESLWYECRPYGIHVSLVQPGFVNNDALQHLHYSRRATSRMQDCGQTKSLYSVFDDFVRALYDKWGSSQDRAVEAIIHALTDARPAVRYPATRDAHFFFLIRRFLPRRFYHFLLYRGLPRELREIPPEPIGGTHL